MRAMFGKDKEFKDTQASPTGAASTVGILDKLVSIIPKKVSGGSRQTAEPREKVRISFNLDKEQHYRQGRLSIGKDVAYKLGVKPGDRVEMRYMESDIYTLYLIPSTNVELSRVVKGISLPTGGVRDSFYIYFTWDLFKVKDTNRFIKTVNYEIIEENGVKALKLDLSSYKETVDIENFS